MIPTTKTRHTLRLLEQMAPDVAGPYVIEYDPVTILSGYDPEWRDVPPPETQAQRDARVVFEHAMRSHDPVKELLRAGWGWYEEPPICLDNNQ